MKDSRTTFLPTSSHNRTLSYHTVRAEKRKRNLKERDERGREEGMKVFKT